MGKFTSDVDIDFADRELALQGLPHIAASRLEKDVLKKHNVGVYFQSIPQDPITGLSSIEYKEAEERGYFKLDFLNLGIYKNVRDEDHLIELVNREPLWELLQDQSIVDDTPLFQLSGHFDILEAMTPQTIEQLAMVIAMIRPAKRHLVGKTWQEIENEVWIVNEDEGYAFKRSHSIGYAMVIVVQMNLLIEQVIG